VRKYLCSLLSVSLLLISQQALSQTSGVGLGRIMTDEEINNLMYTVGPTGVELPAGEGTAREGEKIYTQSCIFCHGPEGLNGPQNTLKGSPRLPMPTSLWDYIHRAMPRSLAIVGAQERQLSNDETYALTAYILYINGVIGHDEVMNAESLLKVDIPMEKKPIE